MTDRKAWKQTKEANGLPTAGSVDRVWEVGSGKKSCGKGAWEFRARRKQFLLVVCWFVGGTGG